MARLAAWPHDRIASKRKLNLSASFGVATNKLVAKIASDLRKPARSRSCRPARKAAFLAPLPIRKLWGVGQVTGELERLGVQTIGDLARLPLKDLQWHFGSGGEWLWQPGAGRQPGDAGA